MLDLVLGSRRPRIPLAALLSLGFAVATPIAAQDGGTPVDLDWNGFVWVDYGTGDRYPDEQGGDRFEVSQLNLGLTATWQNVEAYAAIGAVGLLAEPGDSSDVFVTEAFVTWRDFAGNGSHLIGGLTPLYFGLKANGFPGDRSIQAGLEFGGAGGFAVSQQVAPAVVYEYKPGDTFSIRGGAFDTSSSTAQYFEDSGLGEIDGSSLSKNYFVDVRWDAPAGRGFYAFFGWENRYIGDDVDGSKPIWDAGIGWGNDKLDLSVEYIDIDKDFVGLADNDQYSIAELTLHVSDRVDVYGDYADASESGRNTQRYGVIFEINRVLGLQLEYSQDDRGEQLEIAPLDPALEPLLDDLLEPVVAERKTDSVDVRLAFTF